MLRFILILSTTAVFVAIPVLFLGRIVPEPHVETTARDQHEQILASGGSGLSTAGFLDRFGSWIGYNAETVTASAAPFDTPDVSGSGGLDDSADDFSGSTFLEDFSDRVQIEESLEEVSSASPHWWVTAGGLLELDAGVGQTISGTLPVGDPWQERYASGAQAEVTDDGTHPQNAFRAVQRGLWENVSQEVYFNVQRLIYSEHEQRGATNGVFLMSRYSDSDNLYYAGIRVDGTVTIKKKKAGVYHTLLSATLYDGEYDRAEESVLLPTEQWIGLRITVENNADGHVDLILSVDRDRSGRWEIIGSATDDGQTYDGAAFTDVGHTGIRTDFMDVQFDDYLIRTIN